MKPTISKIALLILSFFIINTSFAQDKFLTAAAKGDYNKVAQQLKKGTDVNSKNHLKWTALAYAAKYGHMNVVELLVEKGANINYRNNTGFTPLIIAFLNGKSDVFKYLIDKGADPNIKDMVGMSVMAYAVKEGKLKAVKYLVETGNANVNIKNSSGRTPMDMATDQDIKDYLRSKGGKTGKELLAG